ELERHPANLDGEIVLQQLDCLGELSVANGAPGTHHIRPDVDRDRVHAHCSSHHCSRSCAIACFGGGMKLELSSSAAIASATSARANHRASSISVASMARSRLSA